MKMLSRQFLWIFIWAFFVFSLVFAAYFLGRQHGIEQVYNEEIPKMQIIFRFWNSFAGKYSWKQLYFWEWCEKMSINS